MPRHNPIDDPQLYCRACSHSFSFIKSACGRVIRVERAHEAVAQVSLAEVKLFKESETMLSECLEGIVQIARNMLKEKTEEKNG